MQFSLLDFKKKNTCDCMTFSHLTQFMLLQESAESHSPWKRSLKWLGRELPYFPDYKSHLNISRTLLFLPKIWEKFINKSHLSISRTLFCYFLARRNDPYMWWQEDWQKSGKTWSTRDALSLADRDITTATWGPELCAQHGTSGRSFPTLCWCVQ